MKHDFARYQRQICLDEVGVLGQEKLQNSRILVVGAGGLSASLLPILVGSGIGFIRLYDADIVDLTNLHRQILYRMDDIGRYKVQAAKQHLQQLNPSCEIEDFSTHIRHSNLDDALQDIDLVVDAADQLSVSYLLSAHCFAQKIPLVSASVLAQHGYVGAFCGEYAPSYQAVFPRFPMQLHSCQSAGVFASTVAALASLQAHMILNLLLKIQPSALGLLLNVNLKTWHMSQICFDQVIEPDEKMQWIEPSELMQEDLILELRDRNELVLDQFQPCQRVDLTLLEQMKIEHNHRIVCVCQTGTRALKAWQILTDRGFKHIVILDH